MSIQNGSSRLLISQVFLPRSVPNRHLQGALRIKRFLRTSVPNLSHHTALKIERRLPPIELVALSIVGARKLQRRLLRHREERFARLVPVGSDGGGNVLEVDHENFRSVSAHNSVHARDRWLQRLTRQLDSDPRPLTRQGRTGARLPADDHVRVERAIAAGSESESAT
jgi:hypothetical protein